MGRDCRMKSKATQVPKNAEAKVVINGFGRMGRGTLAAALKQGVFGTGKFRVLKINDPGMDVSQARELFKHDSAFGSSESSVSVKFRGGKNYLVVDGQEIEFTTERDPRKVELGKYKMDDLQLIDCSGRFAGKDEEGNRAADAFLEAGAREVIISRPSGEADATIVMGVNHWKISEDTIRSRLRVLSNASCTTNSLAPALRVIQYGRIALNDEALIFLDREKRGQYKSALGIELGQICTVHSATLDQNLLDAPHSDWNRMWGAYRNIIPTSTGAAAAIKLVMPELFEKLDGMPVKAMDGIAMRVPLEDVSATYVVLLLKRETTIEDVEYLFKQSAKHPDLEGILSYRDRAVSSTILGDPSSAIVTGDSTRLVGGKLLSFLSWYDNESGYSNRIVDLARYTGQFL